LTEVATAIKRRIDPVKRLDEIDKPFKTVPDCSSQATTDGR